MINIGVDPPPEPSSSKSSSRLIVLWHRNCHDHGLVTHLHCSMNYFLVTLIFKQTDLATRSYPSIFIPSSKWALLQTNKSTQVNHISLEDVTLVTASRVIVSLFFCSMLETIDLPESLSTVMVSSSDKWAM